jgi:hypothetical protein
VHIYKLQAEVLKKVCYDYDLLSPDLNRDLSGKEGHADNPGVDSIRTAVSPGFCTATRRFQDKPS